MARVHFSSNGAQLLGAIKAAPRQAAVWKHRQWLAGIGSKSMCCMCFALCVHSCIMPCLMALSPRLVLAVINSRPSGVWPQLLQRI